MKAAVPNARELEWPGASHYVYMTDESGVLCEMHAFIDALPPRR